MTNYNQYWPIKLENLRNLFPQEPFVCMFSGGKDCGLSLALALQQGNLCELLHCINQKTQQSIWHLQSQKIVEKQAWAISSSVKFVTFSAWERRTRLLRLYREYANQGIKSIVFGDLHEEQQAKLQAALCLSAGLIPRMPLWKRSYKELLELKKIYRIESVITCIKSNEIGSEWLGKQFDEKAYQHFKMLGIDPMGELDEFHTTLVDANYFKKSICYSFGEIENIFGIRKVQILLAD